MGTHPSLDTSVCCHRLHVRAHGTNPSQVLQVMILCVAPSSNHEHDRTLVSCRTRSGASASASATANTSGAMTSSAAGQLPMLPFPHPGEGHKKPQHARATHLRIEGDI